jgi:flagellar biogenesis protein FliO
MMDARNGKSSWAAMSGERLLDWLRGRLHGPRRTPSRLALVERIALAPRQSLALVEAEGRRFLVATSPEGGPAFYALDERARARAVISGRSVGTVRSAGRVSW